MINVAFTLKKHDKTNEAHLFAGDFTPTACNSGSSSVCKEVSNSDCSNNTFTCKNEQEARELCAKLGRVVCANCVKELYKTLK